jgi:molybdopterin-guanine dinucleotide biosynthesis protein A
MGGPKSFLRIGGIPILEYLLAKVAWEGPTMLVTGIGNEAPPGREGFDRELTDLVPGEGPLRGVFTALSAAKTEWVAMSTVDMVEVTREMIEYLIQQAQDKAGISGAMFERVVGGVKLIEPFPCVLRRAMLNAVERRIHEGRLSVHRLSEDGVRLVSPLAQWGQTNWRNLNVPGDLDKLTR